MPLIHVNTRFFLYFPSRMPEMEESLGSDRKVVLAGSWGTLTFSVYP